MLRFTRIIQVLLALAFCGQSAKALNRDTFPTPPDKKGISVQMIDDAIALRIHHATLNVTLGSLMASEGEPGALKFTHNGRDFGLTEIMQAAWTPRSNR